MNESSVFNMFSIKNICRVCLKSTNHLILMSDEHINMYRSLVDEIAQYKEYNMKTCIICSWLLRRFSKFKHQCQSANNLLKEISYKDPTSFISMQNLKASHNMIQKKLQTHSYNPYKLASDTFFNDTNDKCIVFSDTYKRDRLSDTHNHESDTCNNRSISDNHNHSKLVKVTNNKTFQEYNMFFDGPKNDDRFVNVRHHNADMLNDDTYDNHDTEMTHNNYTPNEVSFKNEDAENDIINDTYNCDTQDNDIFIDNDEDEIPLVLLKTNDRNKKKRKKKNSMFNQKEELTIKQEILNEESLSDIANVKPKKRTKELREGFSSRMVQETNEYLVIKLSKEQVLQEMEARSKSDSFLRSPFRCEKCVKGFNFEDVLQTHLEKHSMENGTFQCDMCGQYCPSAVSLRGHIKSHTTRYKCKLCGHVRLSRQHLLEHHAITHTSAATSYNCDYCQFTTNKRTVMQRHVRRHGAGEPHACDKCGKLFKSIESLRLHTVRHDKSSRFQCDRCDNTFVYASLLRKHVLCVHERRDYYCVECDVQFKSNESLRLHFKKAKRHRDSSAYKYECENCSQRFFTPASLAVHQTSVHNVPKSHACTLCRRVYSSRDALRAHSWRVHSSRRVALDCQHCGCSFTRKSSLKLHIRSHSGERPHSCPCGATFAHHKTLLAHAQAKHKKDEIQQYENKIEM